MPSTRFLTSFCMVRSILRSVRPHCGHIRAANFFRFLPGLSWWETPGAPGWCPGDLPGAAPSGSSRPCAALCLSSSRRNLLRSFAYPVASEGAWFQLSCILTLCSSSLFSPASLPFSSLSADTSSAMASSDFAAVPMEPATSSSRISRSVHTRRSSRLSSAVSDFDSPMCGLEASLILTYQQSARMGAAYARNWAVIKGPEL